MDGYGMVLPFCGGKISQPSESHVRKKQLEAFRGITTKFAVCAWRIHRDRDFERPVADVCIMLGILAVPRRAITVNQSDGALECRFLTFGLDELLGESWHGCDRQQKRNRDSDAEPPLCVLS
jgi:hypothetical protein